MSGVLPPCLVQWPNLGPAGGLWTCTLDLGHEGDHKAHVTGDALAFDKSAVIPQGHSAIIGHAP